LQDGEKAFLDFNKQYLYYRYFEFLYFTFTVTVGIAVAESQFIFYSIEVAVPESFVVYEVMSAC
jgi:hypothetical protein